MRVDICHEFRGAARDQVEALYMLDDEFNRGAFARMGFERVVLAQSRVGDLLVRTLRLNPIRNLPAPFSSLVSSSSFHIIEQITYDFSLHEGTWRTTPSMLSQHFAASGTLYIDAYEPGTVFRLVGEATSTLPLVGKRAEKQAVATAEQQHATLANEVAQRLLELEGERDTLVERHL